ncbi:MAG: hypothetical protein ISR82_00125 [Candidatus Marinimicrobia bacterium]|nr:hypothetical protein [Candidatus Neomarinimicrobiota bacterium]MBL7009609.1 hypothetical protein [Candidatus Neomarinimicrobiota bacterium]MBL7029648.1 hypothetical protein [Candidatus Neomarinimicrobiota bacterium]
MPKRKYAAKIKSIRRQEISSSELTYFPNKTSGPDSELDTPSSGSWVLQDATTVPEIGEPQKVNESFAESPSALIDKHLFSSKKIPFAAIVIVLGFIIIQDNGAGNLADWNSILWSMKKSGYIILLYSLISFLQWIYQKIVN